MAIYHASLRVVTRSKGESAVAAAAYRAGIALRDDRLGLTQDYSRRKGVGFVTVLTPAGAPSWASDTSALWNAAEGAETRVNARVARELIVSLPHELPEPVRRDLARDVAQVLVDRYGVAVQLATHAPDRASDARNHHVHLLMTTRSIGPDGFGPKVRVLDDRTTGPQEVEWLRAKVAELTNAALGAAGVTERVDHRSLQAQAVDAEAAGDYEKAAQLTREPTRYLGRAATAALRRGERVEKADSNAAVLADHRRALVTWRWATRKDRRRLRALVEARAHRPRGGAGSTASAGPIQGWGPLGASPRRRRRLEEDLMQVVQEGRRLAEAALDAAGRREQLAALLAKAADPATREGLRRALEAHEALDAARAQSVQRQARLREARERREADQAAWDAVEGGRPSAWRPDKRQAWEQQRRQLWGRLRKAVAREREAQADLSPVAKAALRAKVSEARKRLADAEAALRRRPTMSQLLPEASVPASQPQSRPRPH